MFLQVPPRKKTEEEFFYAQNTIFSVAFPDLARALLLERRRMLSPEEGGRHPGLIDNGMDEVLIFCFNGFVGMSLRGFRTQKGNRSMDSSFCTYRLRGVGHGFNDMGSRTFETAEPREASVFSEALTAWYHDRYSPHTFWRGAVLCFNDLNHRTRSKDIHSSLSFVFFAGCGHGFNAQ